MSQSWNPANLIVNDQGRIYHLDLNGEEIGDIVFLVGDPERVAVVSKHFDHIDLKRSKREFTTHTGRLGKLKVSALSTGISTSNIDIALNELDAIANIDLKERKTRKEFRKLTFIRLGTSGSIDPNTAVDSIVASQYALGFDGLLLMYQGLEQRDPTTVELEKKIQKYFHLRGISYPTYLASADRELLKFFKNRYPMGITATMHGFYAPQCRELRLSAKYPNLIDILTNFEFQGNRFSNIEMESSAIYGLSELLGHRALSFNCIIANRARGEFSEAPYLAVENMIKKVLSEVEEWALEAQ